MTVLVTLSLPKGPALSAATTAVLRARGCG